MQPEGVSFVNVGVWLGLLRWITLGLLIVACFVLINKDKKEQKSKRSLAMLIFTAIAMPFLILEINFKSPEPENVDKTEEEILVPSKKPEIEGDTHPTVNPDEDTEDNTDDTEDTSENSYTGNTSRRSYHPKEAPQTTPEGGSGDTPVTPDDPDDPDAPTVTYDVIHEKMDLDGTSYTVADSDHLSGKAGKKVTPDVKTYEGFTAPAKQTVTLPEDNTLEITYKYTRNKYRLTIDSGDVETTTPSGDYYYETPITLKAKDVLGWDFDHWSNGSTDIQITFELKDNTTIRPIYTPRTDTAYRVSHQQMDLDGEHYTEVDHYDGTGTTGTEVTPPVNTYEHFNSPAAQTAIIAGDGSTNVVYKYDRKKYSYSYGGSEFVESSKPEGDYYYQTTINIKAKDRAGYDFTQWSNGDTNQETTITIDGATTITPMYTAKTDTPYMVRHRKMSIDGSSYTEEEDPKTGTTDTEVTPATKTYTGYTAPNAQTVTISGTGDTEVIYEYTPNPYNVVFHANNGTSATATQAVHYDEVFTLDANTFTKTHYSFREWNTEADGTGTPYTDEQQNIKNLAESGDFDLYAIWNADSYTIHFDKNNEDATGSMRNQTVYFDTPFRLTQNAFQLEGRYFNGWSKNKDAQSLDYEDKQDINTNLTDGNEVTLYAIWGKESYTVHFDLNYENPDPSTQPDDVSVLWDDMIQDRIPADPVRPGYVLTGWYDDPVDESNRLSWGTKIVRDITYYAHWKKRITQADVDNIEVVRESSESIVVRNASELESFTCSSADTSIATVDGGCTVTGVTKGDTFIYLNGQSSHESYPVAVKVKPIKYTVTFDSNGGSAIDDRQVEENAAIGALPVPTYEGYVLVGWFIDDTQINNSYTVTGGITVTAHWLRDISTATAPNKTVTRTETVTVTINNPDEYEEYTCTASDPTTIATVTSDCVVTGVAKGPATVTITGQISGHTKTANITVSPIMYTVSFDEAGGSEVQNMDVEENTQIGTLPSSDKQDYVLEGWYDNNTKIDNTFIPTADITLTAHWLRDINTATAPAITLTRTNSATLTIENPNEYEEFECTASTDTSIATFTSACVITGVGAGEADITITGKLSNHAKTIHVTVNPIKYSVTFNTGEGGPVVRGQEVVENTEIGTLPTPTKEGYILEGWYTDLADPTTNVDEHYIPTANVELFANWVEDGNILVCKVAEELLTETCKQTGSNGCDGLKNDANVDGGTIVDNTITYGKIPASGDPEAGYAYDCDVNADGEYNSKNERFYYLSKDAGSNVARLVYSNNYDIGRTGGIDEYRSEPYGDAISLLPTEEIWTNTHLVKYDDNKIVRFPMQNDIISACGITGSLNNASMKKCIFIMQGTQFRENQGNTEPNMPRAGIWLYHDEGDNYCRVQGKEKKATCYGSTTSNSNKNGARPVIQVPLDYIEQPEPIYHTVEFDALGGGEIAPITEEENKTIVLPTTTKAGFQLAGWSKTQDGSQVVGTPGNNYTVTEDIKLYAVWTSNYVACYDDCDEESDFTSTLQAAINKAQDSSKKTVTLLKNQTENVTIASGQNIEFDLQNFTLTKAGTVVENNGTLTINNGTIDCTSGGAAINNAGTLTITGGTVKTTGTPSSAKQAIYNDGGTLYIEGGEISTVSTSGDKARAAVHNLSSGTTVITGGTISAPNLYAVFNASGNLTIGEKDGYIDTSKPTIIGKTYGIVAYSAYKFYDGTIKGETESIGIAASPNNNPSITVDTNHSKISEIEDNTVYKDFNEDSYKVLQLETLTPKYLIQFDANGGTVSPASKSIDQGAQVGELPTPQRGNYVFDGWYTDRTAGDLVDNSRTPITGETYYAHWHFPSSDAIVTHYTPTTAASNYFNNVTSWSQNVEYVPYSSTGYQPSTSMIAYWNELKSNYENNQCQNSDIDDISSDFNYTYNSGSVKCDQQVPYDTGIGTKVNVYLSDENTKIKGSPVAYTKSDNGTITNMIPGTTYYWESDEDSDAYGYVKATGERRFITTNSIRNVRDLGGLETNDGQHIKYGILMRGEKLRTDSANVTDLEDLGITKEYDLRGETTSDAKIGTPENIRTRQYHFNYSENQTERSYYNDTRNAFDKIIRDVIAGENIYFHCTYGADRTGTIAYLIETLLDIKDEERIEDYELTTLAGEADRTRFYDHKLNSPFYGENKFVYMRSFIMSKEDVVNWYKASLTTDEDKAAADTLFAQFRAKVLE